MEAHRYNIGQCFIDNFYHKEFIIKTVFTSFDLYKCSNVKPDTGSHGIPIFLEIYVTSEYITNCLEEK